MGHSFRYRLTGGTVLPHVQRSQLAVVAMFVLNGSLYGAWASRIPAIQDEFQLDPRTLGLYLLVLAAGAIVSFPVAGKLCDRFGAAKTTRSIALLYRPALIFIGLSSSHWTLIVAIFLFGAAHGSMDVAMDGWGAEVERAKGRSVMSLFHAMFSLGAGLGAAAGGLAAWFSLGYPFHFALFATAAGGLLLFTFSGWESRTGIRDQKKSGITLPRGRFSSSRSLHFQTH